MLHSRWQHLKPKFSLNSRILFWQNMDRFEGPDYYLIPAYLFWGFDNQYNYWYNIRSQEEASFYDFSCSKRRTLLSNSCNNSTINICEETCPKRIKTESCQFKVQDWIVYDCMMAIWTWVKSHAKLSTAELNQAKSSWAKKRQMVSRKKRNF